MIYHLALLLRETFPQLGFLRIFSFITVRSACSLFVAFFVCLLIGPSLIAGLRRMKAGQPIQKLEGEDVRDLSEMHGDKADTPTMGGLMILLALLISVFLFCRWDLPMTWLMIFMTLGFGAIGFADDFLKLKHKNSVGLKARYKLIGQALLGLTLAVYLLANPMELSYELGYLPVLNDGVFDYAHLSVPLLKYYYPYIGWLFVPLVILILCFTSNAVNLTDGLDGLAIGVTTINALAFVVITYLLSRVDYATYLFFPYVPQGGELTVLLSAMVGAGLGFLWFNSHPAEVFMGDTGSLMLGGLLGTVAVIMKQEILLIIIGGIFVFEALSVIIQVVSYKTRGKRVFLMAPIHHHFERAGLPESKIIARFWIVAILLALIGIGTLKLR